MNLKQLENLTVIDQDLTDESYGNQFDKRNIEQLLNYGFNFSDDLSVFDKIIETDGLDINQVLEIAKTTVSELF